MSNLSISSFIVKVTEKVEVYDYVLLLSIKEAEGKLTTQRLQEVIFIFFYRKKFCSSQERIKT
jgi:hypothetical protein